MDNIPVIDISEDSLDTPSPMLSKDSFSKTQTVRFDLKLTTGAKGYAEFSYPELMKISQEKKDIIVGDFQFRKPSVTAKRKSNFYEGYDQDDSFIDDSAPFDESVPSEMSTEFGGFYVNQGKLSFIQHSGLKLPSSINGSKKAVKFDASKEIFDKSLEIILPDSPMTEDENDFKAKATTYSNAPPIDKKVKLDKPKHLKTKHSKWGNPPSLDRLKLPCEMNMVLKKVNDLSQDIVCKKRTLLNAHPKVLSLLMEIDSMSDNVNKESMDFVYQYLSKTLHFSVRTLKINIKKLRFTEQENAKFPSPF